MHKRSNEPIFWSLFGAGGMVSAMVIPAVVLITGIAWPLGLMSEGALGYERISGFAGSFIGGLILWVVISLTLWHAAHRIGHAAHDFGVHRGLGVWKAICYGAAGLGTLWSLVLVVRLWFG